MDLREYSV
jgi:hypothetical protein